MLTLFYGFTKRRFRALLKHFLACRKKYWINHNTIRCGAYMRRSTQGWLFVSGHSEMRLHESGFLGF